MRFFGQIVIISGVFYGVLPPLNSLINKDFEITGYSNFRNTEFLILSVVSIISFYVGYNFVKTRKINFNVSYNSLIFCSILASVFFFINHIRIPTATLFLGKAIYQEALADLSPTLPSGIFYAYSSMMIGATLKKGRIARIPTLLISIYLIFNLFLGRRSVILISGLSALAGYVQDEKIRIKYLIMFILTGLIFSSFVYTLRSKIPLIISGNLNFIELIVEEDTQNLFIKNLNPVNSEFGAPLYNYSVYRDRPNKNLEFSFFEIFYAFIPRSFFPFMEKPILISQSFRDKYFPEYSKRSRIAGTAFSPIVETINNFGLLGLPVVFFLIGAILKIIFVKSAKYQFGAYLISSLIGVAFGLWRSQISDLISNIAILVFVYLLYLIVKSIPIIFKRDYNN